MQLQFFSDPAFEKLILPIQVRKNMYLICKEAINNAIKYADCTQISVSFKMTATDAELCIADDRKALTLWCMFMAMASRTCAQELLR